MRKSRDELDKLINKHLSLKIDKKISQEGFQILQKKHDIEMSEFFDIVSGKRDIIEFDDFHAFMISEILDKTLIQDFFTPDEIKKYSEKKVDKDTVSFPYKFPNMIQVAPDQWIGRITVQTLMSLRKAQLINYNENTQRTLSKITNKEKEFFRITLNKKAVNAIKDSMNAETYIPNTITLNIPEDADFSYSPAEACLRFHSSTTFDILDGYHRYIAMGRICDLDENFDYPMELRMVKFPESKAQQFIYQEDQKTKMSKVDADSMNQTDEANQVVKRINLDPTCNWNGLITRTGEHISFSDLAELIRDLFFKKVVKSQKKQLSIILPNYLVQRINLVTSQDYSLVDKRWSYHQLALLFMIFASDIPMDKYYTTYEKYSVDFTCSKPIKTSEKNEIMKKIGGDWACIMNNKN